MKRFFLLPALAVLLGGCVKEKLEGKNFDGKWSCTSIRYAYLKNDSTLVDSLITAPATLDITNSSPIKGSYGGTVYGDYASGRAHLAFETAPGHVYLTDGEIAFTQGIEEKPKLSYRNKYEGLMMFWRDNVSSYDVFHVNMTLAGHDRLLMRIRTHSTIYDDDIANEQVFDMEFKRN